jgi:gliding motility-associated-like protein
MRHFLFLLLIFTITSISPPHLLSPNFIGIETDQDFTPEELVRDIFIKGKCQNVSNIEPIGNDLSLGHFYGGLNVIGFSEGIIISSGDVALAKGPNESAEASVRFNDASGDPDLELYATNVVLDAGGIEFDFVPLQDTVTFKYVFASEEYCEFVNSIFNDVFGFFVSGPGINGDFANGAINVATLPNSTDYVEINTVNHLSNPDSYIKNELQIDANKCNIPFNPQYLDLIEYDGFTIPLTATFAVIPCETYHIRLVVADVGDDKLDSAVFLETKSFDIGEQVTVQAEVVDSPEPIAFENCRDGQFVFDRKGLNFDEPLTVNFTIHPESTAENGIDFISIPNSITIPAGEKTAILPIEIIADGIMEDVETLRLDLNLPCECVTQDSSILYISDVETLDVYFEEISVCEGQEFTISPEILGGAAPYEFLWETGDTTSFLIASVSEARHYEVTITDACGGIGLGVAGIDLQSEPIATISGEVGYCEGESAFLEVQFGGNPPWSFTYSIDGIGQFEINNIFENPYSFSVNQTGLYELKSFQDQFCEGQSEGMGIVYSGGVEVNFTIKPPTCFDTFDGEIEFEIINGKEPLGVQWNQSVNNIFQPTNLQAGLYKVSIIDADGCEIIEEIDLTPIDPNCQNIEFYVPNIFSPNDDGINDYFQIFFNEETPVVNIKSLFIFNRWGGTVYEKLNFLPKENERLWNGKVENEKSDTGVYVWQILVELEGGGTKVLAGDVALIR